MAERKAEEDLIREDHEMRAGGSLGFDSSDDEDHVFGNAGAAGLSRLLKLLRRLLVRPVLHDPWAPSARRRATTASSTG